MPWTLVIWQPLTLSLSPRLQAAVGSMLQAGLPHCQVEMHKQNQVICLVLLRSCFAWILWSILSLPTPLPVPHERHHKDRASEAVLALLTISESVAYLHYSLNSYLSSLNTCSHWLDSQVLSWPPPSRNTPETSYKSEGGDDDRMLPSRHSGPGFGGPSEMGHCSSNLLLLPPISWEADGRGTSW